MSISTYPLTPPFAGYLCLSCKHRHRHDSLIGRAHWFAPSSLRNPIQEPRFGDVFEFRGAGFTYKAMFLTGSVRPAVDDWTGLTLDDGFVGEAGVVEKFVGLNRGVWIGAWSYIGDIP